MILAEACRSDVEAYCKDVQPGVKQGPGEGSVGADAETEGEEAKHRHFWPRSLCTHVLLSRVPLCNLVCLCFPLCPQSGTCYAPSKAWVACVLATNSPSLLAAPTLPPSLPPKRRGPYAHMPSLGLSLLAALPAARPLLPSLAPKGEGQVHKFLS